MSRKTLIESLLKQKKTDEEIVEILLKGDDENPPVRAKTVEQANKFAKLILYKAKKQLSK